MNIEIERGWLRLGDRAVYWAGPEGNQSENRQPGDPWFEWKNNPEDGTGYCWLGRLQIQWEYPAKGRDARLAARDAAMDAQWAAEEGAERTAAPGVPVAATR